MANQHGCNQKCEGGPDAAALFGYMNGDSRQREKESLSEIRNADQAKEKLRSFRALLLQKVNHLGKYWFGDGNHEQEKQERETGISKCLRPKVQREGTHPKDSDSENDKNGLIR